MIVFSADYNEPFTRSSLAIRIVITLEFGLQHLSITFSRRRSGNCETNSQRAACLNLVQAFPYVLLNPHFSEQQVSLDIKVARFNDTKHPVNVGLPVELVLIPNSVLCIHESVMKDFRPNNPGTPS